MNPVVRRALRVGAVAFGLGTVGIGTGASAAAWFRNTSDRVGAGRAVLEREVAELTALRDLEARSDSLRRQVVALAPLLLPGTTEAEAQAELLASIESGSSAVGATIELTEPRPDSVASGRLRRVQAQATIVANFADIVELITRLEWGARLMLVRRVRIEAQSAGPQGESLRAELTVEGWFLADERAAIQ